VHHGKGLFRLTKNQVLVDSLSSDYRTADITPAERGMLDYVVKLTRTPENVAESDVETLKRLGFDDTGILDIAQVVAYYAFVNRMAQGLGVELEDYWDSE